MPRSGYLRGSGMILDEMIPTSRVISRYGDVCRPGYLRGSGMIIDDMPSISEPYLHAQIRHK